MKKLLNFLDNNFWLVLFLIPLPSIFALFLRPGYFGVSDDIHIAWLYEMDRVIKSGKFPPRYVPDLSYGFGYPLFNFVFPLPFYLGEIFHLVGFNLVDSIKIVLGLSLFLSFLFMYFLLRRFVGRALSILGGVIYLYAPYRATDVYVRGAVGESLSFIFLPLILLSFLSLLDEKRKVESLRWIGIGSLAIAGLILSHNITAYMFLPLSLFLPLIFFLFRSNKSVLLLGVFAAFFAGLLVSCYFWVPAFLDSRQMKYDTVFDYFDHFPTLKQLITPYFGYGASVPGPYDQMSFFVGIPQILIILLGFIFFIYNFKKINRERLLVLIWSFLILIFSVFMMNYRSMFIWGKIPLLPYFQFPWRFLGVVVFCSSLIVIVFEDSEIKKLLFFVLVLLSVILGLNYFKPNEYLERKDDYYINRYIPVPVASQEYRKTSEEYLRLPLATQLKPDVVLPILFGGGFSVNSLREINSLDIEAKISNLTQSDVLVNYRKYNFPGWFVQIDGKMERHRSGEPFGQVSFSVPAGSHNILIIFEETLRNKILDLISAISFLGALYLIFYKKFNQKIL